MAKLYLNKPNRPQGEPLRVGNLGVFENGGEYDIPGDEDIHIPPQAKPRQNDESQESEDDTSEAPVGLNLTGLSSRENLPNDEEEDS